MASNWTIEQKEAINIEGSNVIVSAGAGSGKTAVLSERVLRKVKEGTHINELLVLTFTKAAAKEMKDRIKDKLIENNLDSEAQLIDGAYITTFDSYSLLVVKKYHYILGINRDIKISDTILLNIIKRDLLDEIMDEYYKEENEKFKNLVCKFSLKDDRELKDLIIKLSDKLELKYDRYQYLENYMKEYYSEESLEELTLEYQENVFKELARFRSLTEELSSHLEDKKLGALVDSTTTLINSKTYEELSKNIRNLSLPRSNGYSLEAKKINESLKKSKDELIKLCIYDTKVEMLNEVKQTYDDTSILVEILMKLDMKNRHYKKREELYDFNDISHLAIKLVKENQNVREDIKNSFKEILIDEYQDTSDNQELFISFINNNNVYMVGDIKQSIYRFRNANPYIFKEKYDTYNKDKTKGIKIDLAKNFRSRGEVLDNINMLFENVMDDYIGGANYKSSHKAIFGNTSYNKEGETKQDYNLVINTYREEKDRTNTEQEAFIIAEDIKRKIADGYLIFDKNNKKIRKACFDDFVILLDKKKNFDLYKKIFEYMNVPLTVYREEKINNTDDFLVIYNLFKLVLFVYNEDFSEKFRYSFLSIARSFLFRYSDNDIYKIFMDNSFFDTKIIKIALNIKEQIEVLPLKDLYRLILAKYNYYEKLLTTTDIEKHEKCIEYLDNLIDCLTKEDIVSFMSYLDKVVENTYDIKYDSSVDVDNSVKIMSIHKSKGLEFPICYFADLENKFNMKDQKEKINFSNKYGIILPNIEDESNDTIRKMLYKRFDTIEEISERIRLFYVALTRCKEKLIIVCPEVLEDKSSYSEIVDYDIRRKYSSFYSILKSIWYKLDKYIVQTEIKSYSKNYLYRVETSNLDNLTDEIINVEEPIIEKELIIDTRFSKRMRTIVTKDENDLLELGTKIHKILEQIDFKNPNLINIANSFIKKKVEKFLNSRIIKENLNAKFYKEYEFIYYTRGEKFHGIIDLLIENDDEIIIIDYKLKEIEDVKYNEQLYGYKKYLETLTKKNISMYLYSIIDNHLKKIDKDISILNKS